MVELQGRRGINAQSVHSRLILPQHTLNEPVGTLTLWVAALEDLATVARSAHVAAHEPDYEIFTLISDQRSLREWEKASFAIIWAGHAYPQLWAKFYSGNLYPDGYVPQKRAVVAAGHFNFCRLQWYQMGLTWDKHRADYRLYANGVLLATSNRFATGLEFDPCGRHLYLGNPALVISEIAFRDGALDGEGMRRVYQCETTGEDPALQRDLRRIFAGEFPQPFHWKPSSEWESQLEAPLNRAEDLHLFHVQGYVPAPSITGEGLLVQTPQAEPWEPAAADQLQVYLWTKRTFEGDLAVEFEFKPLQHNGLGLLMIHASGMQREDFMADYPLRTSGSMSMVWNENVRNYHWEFFREMDDTRNDVASSALLKQPWNHPLAYYCMRSPLALDEWHTIQFVQEGPRLRGAIDRTLVFDVTDSPFGLGGPFYQFGRLAIRCMLKTRMVYRNLRLMTRSPFTRPVQQPPRKNFERNDP